MKSSILSFFLTAVFAKQDLKSKLGDDSILKLHDDHAASIADILHDRFGSEVNADSTLSHHFRVDRELRSILEAQNVPFEDTTTEWVSNLEKNLENPAHVCLDGAEKCASKSQEDFYSVYQELDALYARADASVSSTTADVPVSWKSLGFSYEGRPLRYVSIGDEDKPLVLYFCNIHAREWLTPVYCTYMIEMLLEEGGHPLLDIFSFDIVISANPDGYVYTWTDERFWRKTRKPNNGTECVGTDPNRNYAVNHCGEGASTDPCTEIYCGLAPFDQNETAALRDYALANQERLIYAMDVHSFSSLWLYPYGGSFDLPADVDQMEACAVAGVKAIKEVTPDLDEWVYGPSASTIYIAAGGSDDWFYDIVGVIHSYTLELRTLQFDPPANNILPSNREVFAGTVASLTCVIEQEGLNVTFAPTTPTLPETPFPTTGGEAACYDLENTGLEFSDGTPATCDQLIDFCEGQFADLVQPRCPETCGLCDGTLTPTSAPSASPVVIPTEAPTAETLPPITVSPSSSSGGGVDTPVSEEYETAIYVLLAVILVLLVGISVLLCAKVFNKRQNVSSEGLGQADAKAMAGGVSPVESDI